MTLKASLKLTELMNRTLPAELQAVISQMWPNVMVQGMNSPGFSRVSNKPATVKVNIQQVEEAPVRTESELFGGHRCHAQYGCGGRTLSRR